jgi:hypothetical protein
MRSAENAGVDAMRLAQSGKLGAMEPERREEQSDRRANPRGGRRDGDAARPWYRRRRIWLAIASVTYVGWRRIVRRKTTA